MGRGTSESLSLVDSGGGKRTTSIKKKQNNNGPSKATTNCLLNIATYNTISIGTKERLVELEYKLEKINWDIVGTAETRTSGEQYLHLDSEHTMFYRGNDDSN